MSYGNLLRGFKEFGVKETFYKLFQQRTLKFGALVGTDKLGNKYYENTKDYPWGQHRWVEFAGRKSFYDSDPSAVPAEWHPWLHHVTDDIPTPGTVGSAHRFKLERLVQESDAPYADNHGGVVAPHEPNKTLVRPRGYGIGNGISSKPFETGYYTQPGFVLDPRFDAPKVGIDAELEAIEATNEELGELAEEGLVPTLDDATESALGANPVTLVTQIKFYTDIIEQYQEDDESEAKEGVIEAKRLLAEHLAAFEAYKAALAKRVAATKGAK